MKSIVFTESLKNYTPTIVFLIARSISPEFGYIALAIALAYFAYRGNRLFHDLRIAQKRLRELEEMS